MRKWGSIALAVILLVGAAVIVRLASTGHSDEGSQEPGATVKPPMQGLVLQNPSLLKTTDAGLVGGIVANATWAQLQPTGPGHIAPNNPIDQALHIARRFDAANPSQPVYVKIRIFAGVGAPDWVKHLGGFEPVSVRNLSTGQSGTLGPFWTDAFGSAYSELQTELAEDYDQNPLIRDVTIGRCTTIYAEPYQRDVTNFAELYRQGYSVAADERCLHQEIDEHRPWVHTHQSLSFNPFRPWTLDASGTVAQSSASDALPEADMSYCRAMLGDRCTLENNSIRSSYIGLERPELATARPIQLGSYAALYQSIVQRGPATTYQTAGPSVVGDLPATVRWAISLGANSVELASRLPTQTMRTDNQLLQNNPVSCRSRIPVPQPTQGRSSRAPLSLPTGCE